MANRLRAFFARVSRKACVCSLKVPEWSVWYFKRAVAGTGPLPPKGAERQEVGPVFFMSSREASRCASEILKIAN